MTAIELLAVVVPAHNEAELLPDCLRSIVVAAARVRASSSGIAPVVRLMVVLDRCDDGSRPAVEDCALAEFIETDDEIVGAARARGVGEVLATSGVPRERIWIANTDADSVVPEDWLAVQLEFAEGGAAALTGAVRPDGAGLDDRQRQEYLEQHPLRDDHGNVHGANFGVRADRYLAAGGFPPIAVGEDVALFEALAASGTFAVATARAAVTTSSRLTGRTPGGYAEYLRDQLASLG